MVQDKKCAGVKTMVSTALTHRSRILRYRRKFVDEVAKSVRDVENGSLNDAWTARRLSSGVNLAEERQAHRYGTSVRLKQAKCENAESHLNDAMRQVLEL
jgi:hypothetical protein